mmetsp:Transcript_31899/g.101564  ORF Transcript_31899/g.101564 Transcript_31899/m.101564 type:complete len:90 (-) Transcript_31899:1123-1392(-)
MRVLSAVPLLAAAVSAKVYFQEDFNDADWESRWVVPTKWKSESELGTWVSPSVSVGPWGRGAVGWRDDTHAKEAREHTRAPNPDPNRQP